MTRNPSIRLILASHAELHGRIAELEKALAIAHSRNDAAPHELLTNTLLYSPRDPKTNRVAGPSKGSVEDNESYEGSARAGKRRKSGKGKEVRLNNGRERPSSDGNTAISGSDDSEHDPDEDLDSGKRVPRIRSQGNGDQRRAGKDLLEASLGTLTITSNGEARFVGNAAASSHLTGLGSADRMRHDMQARPPHLSLHEPDNLLGDFPFASSITSSREGFTLQDLWLKLPAWESNVFGSLGIQNLNARDFAMRHQLLGARISEGGMDMVKAYWENVDWMYNVVPVS